MDTDTYLDEIEELWPRPGEPPSDQILALCQKAVTEYSDSSSLWYNLGIIMQRCDKERGFTADDFLRCFSNAVASDGTNWEAQQELGYVLDTYFDDFDGAKTAFEKAIEFGGMNESYFGLARVLAQMGKTEEALNILSAQSFPFHDDLDIQLLRSEIRDGTWRPVSGAAPRPMKGMKKGQA